MQQLKQSEQYGTNDHFRFRAEFSELRTTTLTPTRPIPRGDQVIMGQMTRRHLDESYRLVRRGLRAWTQLTPTV
jgi:hypothetical protein